MSQITFKECADQIDLSELKRGVKVILKSEDGGIVYDVEVVVAEVNSENHLGYVDAIFEAQDSGHQVAGDSMLDSLAGYEVSFISKHVHKVIEQP